MISSPSQQTRAFDQPPLACQTMRVRTFEQTSQAMLHWGMETRLGEWPRQEDHRQKLPGIGIEDVTPRLTKDELTCLHRSLSSNERKKNFQNFDKVCSRKLLSGVEALFSTIRSPMVWPITRFAEPFD
jgi:hypothetical protein